jgi:hypothetical protein
MATTHGGHSQHLQGVGHSQHLKGVTPGAVYSGRSAGAAMGLCVRQYIDVSPGANSTRTSSDCAAQNAEHQGRAPSS